ncbi:MAG: DNA ligase-associated DEXH box helicase, partial [Planctomycetota bacterium]
AVESVNLSAMAKTQFREVARVAGLISPSQPGAPRSMRQVQARSSLIYDVFEQFDPQNKLLLQARREVLEKQFERSRLGRTLRRLGENPLPVEILNRPTPLSLPLVIERVGARLSSESIAERVAKMRAAWDKE